MRSNAFGIYLIFFAFALGSAMAAKHLYISTASAGQPWTKVEECDFYNHCHISGTLNVTDDLVLHLDSGDYHSVMATIITHPGFDVSFQPFSQHTEAGIDGIVFNFYSDNSALSGAANFARLNFGSETTFVLGPTNSLDSVSFESCNFASNVRMTVKDITSLILVNSTWLLPTVSSEASIFFSYPTSTASPPSINITQNSSVICTTTECHPLLEFQPYAGSINVTLKDTRLENLTSLSTFASNSEGSISYRCEHVNINAIVSSNPSTPFFAASSGKGKLSLTDSSITYHPNQPSLLVPIIDYGFRRFDFERSNLSGLLVLTQGSESSLNANASILTDCAVEITGTDDNVIFTHSQFISKHPFIVRRADLTCDNSSFLPLNATDVLQAGPEAFQLLLSDVNVGFASYPSCAVHNLGVAESVTIQGLDVKFEAASGSLMSHLRHVSIVGAAYPELTIANNYESDLTLTYSPHDLASNRWILNGGLQISNVIVDNLPLLQLMRLDAESKLLSSIRGPTTFTTKVPGIGISWPQNVNFVPTSGTPYPFFETNSTIGTHSSVSSLNRDGFFFIFTFDREMRDDLATINKLKFSLASSSSPVPPTLPPSPAASCGPSPLPLNLFECINGTYVFNGSLSNISTPVVVATPVVIEGNLNVSTIEFRGLNSTIDVHGCATIPSKVIVTLTALELEMLRKNLTRYVDLIRSTCSNSSGQSINIEVRSQGKKGCEKISGKLNESGGMMAGVFVLSTSGCNTWWIVLVSVLGAVVLIVIVLILIFTLVPQARRCIRPFVRRKRSSLGASHT